MTTNFNIFAELTAVINTATTKLPNEFAISVDDQGKSYTRSLVSLLKEYITVDSDTVKNTTFGDVILFKNNNVKLVNIFEAAFNNVPILSLVKDYIKVERYVTNFFENVYIAPKKANACTFCPIANLCGLNIGKFCIDKPINHSDNRIIYDGSVISVDEKVQIMYNFVKIGYDQYDIVNFFGRQFVDLEGTTYEIKTDRRGRKFLEFVK